MLLIVDSPLWQAHNEPKKKKCIPYNHIRNVLALSLYMRERARDETFYKNCDEPQRQVSKIDG